KRRPGRQFLAAGDSNETVPGKSLLARLIVGILDDKINQVSTDYWTTGDMIGNWIKERAPSLSRAFMGVEFPPTPVYGRLPKDDLYQQGDIAFWRRDQEGIPLLVETADEVAWQAALERPIPTEIITQRTEKELLFAREEVGRQAAAFVTAEARYREVQ